MVDLLLSDAFMAGFSNGFLNAMVLLKAGCRARVLHHLLNNSLAHGPLILTLLPCGLEKATLLGALVEA